MTSSNRSLLSFLSFLPVLLLLTLAVTPALAQDSADLNNDGFVDAEDLLLMTDQWHTEGVVPTPVPPDATVNSEILDVTVGQDLMPVVRFTLEDDNGDPILPADLATLRFTIAKLVDSSTLSFQYYVNYINREATGDFGTVLQPTYDTTGDITDLGNGVYEYKFSQALANYEPGRTHTVGAQIEFVRNEVETVANPIFHFVPDESMAPDPKLVSTTETCNSCHSKLAIHGGGRQEYELCLLCHTHDVIDPDTGNSVDMGEMIHKIHMGADLPSVQSGTPYQIIGFRGSVHDYSEVVFPQDVRNCESCHTGPDGDLWRTNPTMQDCGACHDDVDFMNGVGHFAQQDNQSCGIGPCHADSGDEFDINVPGAHTIPNQSTQLAGFNAEILSVTNVGAGMNPSITFRLFEDDGTQVAIGTANRVAVTAAGPTAPDYQRYYTETISEASSTDNGDGTVTYTLQDPIPADAMGTWGFGMEARRVATIQDAEGDPIEVRYEAIENPFVYAAVTGELEERREVVSLPECNDCHKNLSIHGSLRNQIEYCVMCHNPKETDISRRPGEELPAETVDMKYMIHRIHLGENMATDYTVYGFGGTPHDFSHVLYPATLQNCSMCHVGDTWQIPSPSDVTTTVTRDGVEYEVGHATATCLGCHDSASAFAHMQSNVAIGTGEEACDVCHGPNRSESVESVHNFDAIE